MTRTLTRKGLIAAAVMAVAALCSSALPASAATGPYGFTILHADAGNIAHHCEKLGQGYDQHHNLTDAIVCVDIDTSGGETGYQATGAVEAYCEINGNAADLTPCPGVTIEGSFANASSGAAVATFGCEYNCGSVRNILYVETIHYTNASCTSSAVNQVWTQAEGLTEIDLYSGSGDWLPFTIASNGSNDGSTYSSGHYWICP
jgi:hypothetical protein